MLNIKNKLYIKIILSSAFIITLTIIIAIKYFNKEEIVKINPNIEFLSINTHYADSVLQTLSIDEKLDLIIRSNNIVQHKDINKNVLQQSIYFIHNYKYLKAINDSTLINQYLLCLLNNTKAGNFVVKLNKYEYENTNDSVFANFVVNKYKFCKKTVNNKNVLFGLKINNRQLNKLYNQSQDSNSMAAILYNEIVDKADIILLDSCPTLNKNIIIDGIVAGNCTDSITTDNQIIKLLDSNIDILCTKINNVEIVKQKVKQLIADKKYDIKQAESKLRKLIKAKIWQQSNHHTSNSIKCRYSENLLHQYLTEKSICLLNNKNAIIPFNNSIFDNDLTVAYFSKKINKVFIKNIKHYIEPKLLRIKTIRQAKQFKNTKNNNVIIIIDTSLTDSTLLQIFKTTTAQILPKNGIIVNIGNYDNLKQIPDSIACVQTLSNSNEAYRYAAQSIFGGIALSGQLPYSINKKYKCENSYKSNKTRLKYTTAEDAQLDAEQMHEIDKIAFEGISKGAFPGCQIFVAKAGKVVYNKSFGYHTYDKKQKVKPDDIFDLASVTKIAATTIAIMKMQSDNKLNINDKLKDFFKDTHIDYTRIKPDTLIQIDTVASSSISDWKKFLEHTDTLNINDSLFITIDTTITKLTHRRNIFQVTLIDLLRHKSGIVPAVPIFRYIYYKTYFLQSLTHESFYDKLHYIDFNLPYNFPESENLSDSIKQLIKAGFKKQYDKYFSELFVKDTSEIQLSDNQYFKQEYFDTVWRDIKQLPVFSHKVMQYSDLNMVLLQMAIDSINNETIDSYLKRTIYEPLGLQHITYLALQNYENDKIIPTEIADDWRKGLLKGFVHDPSAALLGGIAGNAGLFANAKDLGILFQMILNKGEYGGLQFINPDVIARFTKRQDDTQRALGFDMPNLKAIVGSKASKNSYGHSGYTGTCVWIDPDNELVYVFLSNRNHPTSDNWKIVNYHIRERIHNVIYDAIKVKRLN